MPDVREPGAIAWAARSRPSHQLDLRRSGGRQALPHASDVWRSEMDAQQHGASCDFALQRFGAFVWQTGGRQHRCEAAGRVSGHFPKLRGERPRRNNWPDPWHHQGDRGQHAATQLSQACRLPRIFEVYSGHRVHPVSKRLRVRMSVCDDRHGFPADPESMKRPRSVGGHGRSREQPENEWMGHANHFTMRSKRVPVGAAGQFGM